MLLVVANVYTYFKEFKIMIQDFDIFSFYLTFQDLEYRQKIRKCLHQSFRFQIIKNRILVNINYKVTIGIPKMLYSIKPFIV